MRPLGGNGSVHGASRRKRKMGLLWVYRDENVSNTRRKICLSGGNVHGVPPSTVEYACTICLPRRICVHYVSTRRKKCPLLTLQEEVVSTLCLLGGKIIIMCLAGGKCVQEVCVCQEWIVSICLQGENVSTACLTGGKWNHVPSRRKIV